MKKQTLNIFKKKFTEKFPNKHYDFPYQVYINKEELINDIKLTKINE